MIVLLLVGGVRTKKDEQQRNFHLNVTVVYILFCHKVRTARRFFFFFFFFFFSALNVLISERRNFADNKISM